VPLGVVVCTPLSEQTLWLPVLFRNRALLLALKSSWSAAAVPRSQSSSFRPSLFRIELMYLKFSEAAVFLQHPDCCE
jgi:hypothetical protein